MHDVARAKTPRSIGYLLTGCRVEGSHRVIINQLTDGETQERNGTRYCTVRTNERSPHTTVFYCNAQYCSVLYCTKKCFTRLREAVSDSPLRDLLHSPHNQSTKTAPRPTVDFGVPRR